MISHEKNYSQKTLHFIYCKSSYIFVEPTSFLVWRENNLIFFGGKLYAMEV